MREPFPAGFRTQRIATNGTSLVAGRERIYLDRFWNEFSADPKEFPEASRAHYAKLYAQPGAMHAGFEQFKAFDQDAISRSAARSRSARPWRS